MEKQDRQPMLRALRLARRGVGRVSPNPPVGAVAMRDGEVIAEAWHRKFGAPHAEAALIASLPAGACRGCDLYVTLEPCAHHGKTPPCTEAILDAGFLRVFYAARDPHPLTRGVGQEQLQAAGVGVEGGLCEESARDLLAPYFRLTTAGVPLVTCKWAMTADGHIATRSGDSHWISDALTRRRTRRERCGYDAILVGRRTVEADHPRLISDIRGRPNPLRVVLDSRLRLSPEDPLVKTATLAPVLVATVNHVSDPRQGERRRCLEDQGIEVLCLPGAPAGVDLGALLQALGQRGVANLL
ncbi:MAG: bifunctional diaminohydroxyphosphoribosylaminopyrimidine deaminase/5-amino-6-(5-phosphoribosylamino)uracil reductase RibD, partial [Planctomycetota bacterium]